MFRVVAIGDFVARGTGAAGLLAVAANLPLPTLEARIDAPAAMQSIHSLSTLIRGCWLGGRPF